MRKVTKPRVDQRVFRYTASSGKKVNLDVRSYRGGYRF